MKTPFYLTESFWLTVAGQIAGLLVTLGYGHLGAEVKAAVDAGALVLAAGYVHGTTSATSGPPVSLPITPVTPPVTTPAPAGPSVPELTAQALSAAAESLRQVQ